HPPTGCKLWMRESPRSRVIAVIARHRTNILLSSKDACKRCTNSLAANERERARMNSKSRTPITLAGRQKTITRDDGEDARSRAIFPRLLPLNLCPSVLQGYRPVEHELSRRGVWIHEKIPQSFKLEAITGFD